MAGSKDIPQPRPPASAEEIAESGLVLTAEGQLLTLRDAMRAVIESGGPAQRVEVLIPFNPRPVNSEKK